ncbi:MAG: hypothetical protein KF760_22100 [Candidatus Eremiobacteraeota bacterium]|nr:hypothetical protein [Candidatus Eremiobacteraeota bacterium]
MSSPLSDNTINTGDVIEAEHITQLFPILAELEDGQAFYRDDVGAADAYQVNFDGSPDNQNQFAAYKKGMLVVFKAANANTGASTLQVVGPGGALTAKSLVRAGGSALSPGDIAANQMVAAVYNDASGGRFEMLGGVGGSSVAALNDLTDVAISSPSPGQVVRYNGSSFVNAAPAASDLSGTVPLAQGGTAQDNSGNNIGMGDNVFHGGLGGGSQNTGVGYRALYGATSCTGNTALGSQAAYANTTGSYRVAIGYQAGLSSTTGTGSTAVGYGALYANTANYNCALGYAAGYQNSSGTSGLFLGNQAGYSNTSGSSNTMCGALAGRQNTTGSAKTCLGASAGYSGSSNDGVTALGYFALQACTAGYNTAAGYAAGYNTTSGAGNSFLGRESAYTNTTGGYNSAFGTMSLRQNSTGSYHTSMGHSALYAATGAGCVAVGYNAGSAITSGNYNTILGSSCATNLTTGSHCIAIGDSVSLASATENGQVNIGDTFRKTGTQQSASVTSKGQSYADSSTTTILSLSNRRGRIEFFDSNDDWAIVRFMGAGTPVIESGSAAWVLSGSPASGEVGLNVSGSNLQMVLGSSAARTIGWVVRDVEF